MTSAFELPAPPSVPVVRGLGDEAATFPVRRVFCVGQNYAAHALEMGFQPDPEAPFFFTKSPWAVCPSGTTIPFPLGTDNCHYEMELVVALGAPAFRIDAAEALSAVFGYACGLDLTRRDLQNAAREKKRPWDFGKDFENAAVIAPITRAAAFGEPADQRIRLTRNGEVKQDSRLSDLIHPVPALIAYLSAFYHLEPGDLIYTGTPSGVGPIAPGDVLRGEVDGLTPVELRIGDKQ